jgi:hypothetical protein
MYRKEGGILLNNKPMIVIKSLTNFITVYYCRVLLSTLHMLYVEWFVSDLRQVGGFLRVLGFPPPIKLFFLNFFVSYIFVYLSG